MILPLSVLWGQSLCERFDLSPLKGGNFELGADLLYWTHNDCEFNYAQLGTNLLFCQSVFEFPPPLEPVTLNAINIPITNKFIVPTYDPGIRVKLTYENQCLRMQARYTWIEIKSKDATRVNDQTPPPVVLEPSIVQSNTFEGGPLNEISGEIISTYQTFCFEQGGNWAMGDWGKAFFAGYFRWTSYDHRRISTAFSPDPAFSDLRVTQKNTFDGAGVGSAVGFELYVCDGLRLITHESAFLMVGDMHVSRKGEAIAAGLEQGDDPFPYDLEFNVPNRTCIIPGWALYVGIGYEGKCGCFSYALDLAYEMQFYVDGVRWKAGQTTFNPDQFSDFFGNIQWGGPSLHFTVGF